MSVVAGRAGCLFFLLLAGALSPVFGKDLNTLSRVLYSAFLAEQGAAMCMVPSIKLSDSDRAVFIDAHNYAQLVKQKVSTGLSDDDVRFVLKSAADRAQRGYAPSRWSIKVQSA